MSLDKTINDIQSLKPELEKAKALIERTEQIGQPKESKTSKHFKISLFKSGVRMFGCVALIAGSLVYAGCLLFIAECLGVIEEL